MNISEAIDRAVKAKWRADLINMLADAGRTLEHANLRANGNVYQDINVGLLLLEAARSLQECQSELEPENPDDVVVKVTVPDRWPMTEAGQRRAAQEAAATKPMTNGDHIQDRKDGELAERVQRAKQAYLDGALREIFGDDLVPFAERHPYIRGIDYTKKRR